MPMRTPSKQSVPRTLPEQAVVTVPVQQSAIEAAKNPAEVAIAPEPVNAVSSASAIGSTSPAENVKRSAPLPPPISANSGTPALSSQIAASQKSKLRVPREERFILQTIRAEKGSKVADPLESARAETPQAASTQENTWPPQEESRSVPRAEKIAPSYRGLGDKTAAKDPSSQPARHDYLIERAAVEPAEKTSLATRPPQQIGRSEAQQQAESGPRVRIGTVEIRMKLPQPPAPPPVVLPPQVQTGAATHARGRSGPVEPLARGLEWSYGLVQG